MEIISNDTMPYDYERGMGMHNDPTQGIIPRRTRFEVEGSAFRQTFRELFSRDYNPFALRRKRYELQKSKWRAAHGRKPSFFQRLGLLFRPDRSTNTLRLIRERYLDNYRQHLNKWERECVTDINYELERLGTIPLRHVRNHTFRILRSIERMIGNLQYDGGPDLSREKNIAAAYSYIFATPHARRYENLTPGELCYRLREAGVADADLPIQQYESILAGQPTATYRSVMLNDSPKQSLQPVHPILLNTTEGGFSIEIHPRTEQGAPLQERRYAASPRTPQNKSPRPKLRGKQTSKPGKGHSPKPNK